VLASFDLNPMDQGVFGQQAAVSALIIYRGCVGWVDLELLKRTKLVRYGAIGWCVAPSWCAEFGLAKLIKK